MTQFSALIFVDTSLFEELKPNIYVFIDSYFWSDRAHSS